MRALPKATVVPLAAAAALLLAPAAHATPNGDNGTVKIHDAATDQELRKNEPKVCTFYLDAFGFDSGQQVDWRIVEMPPTGTKGTVAETGLLTLDAEGLGRTGELSLADGHYKLVWNFEGENGKAKHKVFWVDCDDSEEPGGKPTPSTSAEPGEEPSETPSEEPTGAPSESAPAGGGEPSTEPTPNGGGDLAETGSSMPTGALAAAAASLLGAGAYLVMRRRNARTGRQD